MAIEIMSINKTAQRVIAKQIEEVTENKTLGNTSNYEANS